MTTMLAAEKALLAEVRGRILSFVPEREASLKFSARSNQAINTKRFEDTDRKARIFEIGYGVRDETIYTGNNVRGFYMRYPIRVWYPYLPHWILAANSDVDRIVHDFNTNATTVDGVQNRVIDPTAVQENIVDDEDPWMEISMSLRVHYEISGD